MFFTIKRERSHLYVKNIVILVVRHVLVQKLPEKGDFSIKEWRL